MFGRKELFCGVALLLLVMGSSSVFAAENKKSLSAEKKQEISEEIVVPEAYEIWLEELKQDMLKRGIKPDTIDLVFEPNYYHPKPEVVKIDRRQIEFVLTSTDYLNKVINNLKVKQGQKKYKELYPLFHDMEKKYGVPFEYIVAFWGMETNYGRNFGHFNIIEALVQMSYDKRRPAFFRAELYEALKMIDNWGIDAENISVNSEFSVIEDIIDEGFSHVSEGQIGLDTTTHWIDTQASVLDETGTLGYYTWDGEQYHLDEPAFISSVQNAKSHYQAKHTLDAYTPEEKQSIFKLDPEEEPRVDLWNKGGLALRYGYTYEIPDMLKYNNLNNEYRFIGNPGGKITIVGDYYGINKETTNPQLAYEFAKWMSFGKDGFAKRMELYVKPENGGFMNTLPLTTDSETINEYFDLFGEGSGMDGLSDAFTYIETGGMVEGTKVVPGYLSARQTKKTGLRVPGPEGYIENCNMFDLLNQCVTGSANITEFTTGEINIDDLADATYTDWWEKNGANYTD